MYKEDNKHGVLNDFDLSTVMKPGDRNPNRQGLERTGTLPFMAVELLENEGFDGKVPRRYDHELESFAWVLVWVSRCVVGGEERERPWRLKQWLGNNNDEVYNSKVVFIRNPRKIPATPDYEYLGTVTVSWIRIWDNHLREREDPFEAPFVEKTNSEYLQVLIDACTRCSQSNPIALVPIDLAWVDGLADLNFTAPGHMPVSALDSTVVKEQLSFQRSSHGPSLSDGGDLDVSDHDMYVDDEGASLPNDTEFDDTDGDDDRQSGKDTRTDSESHETDGDEGRG